MIVIYTADVERAETSDVLDAGCLKLVVQSVFLSEMDPEEISRRLYRKVTDRIPLSEEELIKPAGGRGTEGIRPVRDCRVCR